MDAALDDRCPDISLGLRCDRCDFKLDVSDVSGMPGFMVVCECPRVVWIGRIQPEGFAAMMERLDDAIGGDS